MRVNFQKKQTGFSLIEMVIGITTFAVALTIVTSVISPQVTKSVDPIYQVRGTELAQSLLNEILGKYYDENSDRNGGRVRCDEDLANNADELACTAPGSLGPELPDEYVNGDTNFPNRPDFDDIDDYAGYAIAKDEVIVNSLGQELRSTADGEFYKDFSLNVDVFYDSDQNGIADTTSGNIKLVRVTVTTPNDENLVFTSFKHNF